MIDGTPAHASPASTSAKAPSSNATHPSWLSAALNSFRSFISKKREEEAIIEAVEEIMEEPDGTHGSNTGEKELLTNLLNARDRRIADIMIPRADIFAADETTPLRKLAAMMGKSGHSRVPIFRKTLDDVIGFVHIKDVTAGLIDDKPVLILDIIRPLLFIPPSMPVTRLLLQMRQKRQHIALVVDEFGGIDGLVTIEDVVEEIVGEIDDEHDDPAHVIQLQRRADGSIMVDARMPIEAFEEQIGDILKEDERQAIDTLGGLVFTLAGRVPLKGEMLRHTSGLLFEVMDADTRRIKRLRIHNAPKSDSFTTNTVPLQAGV